MKEFTLRYIENSDEPTLKAFSVGQYPSLLECLDDLAAWADADVIPLPADCAAWLLTSDDGMEMAARRN